MARKRCYAVTWIGKNEGKRTVRHDDVHTTTMKGAMTQIGKQFEMVEVLEIKMTTGVAGANYSVNTVTDWLKKGGAPV